MTELEKKEYFKDYYNKINRTCRIFQIIGVTLIIAAPFAMAISLDTFPNLSAFAKGLIQIAIIYIPTSAAEFLIYTPMLGAGGSYLAFITGNVTNMKVPCVLNARDIVGTKTGTPENEIVSALSVATSALVTTLVLAIGVICLIPLTPILESPVLLPAFSNVVPALFGALAAKFFRQGKKIVALPLILMIIVYVLFPSMIANVGVLILVSGAIALLEAYVIFKKNNKEATND